VVGHRLPGAVEVVALHRGEVEVLEDAAFDARVDLPGVSRQERRQDVPLPRLRAVGVELATELGEQQREVALVLGSDHVAGITLGAWPLPVEVEPVEDACRRTQAALRLTAQLGQVALDEQVDAGSHERLARGIGERGIREEPRPGPATQRHQHLELRVLLLELVEIAGKRLIEHVGKAVDALGRGKPPLVVRPRIALTRLVDLKDDMCRRAL